jgi:spore maturation protein CgeB
MRRHLKLLLNEPHARRQLAAHGHRTILSRHTCAHRVDELLEVIAELDVEAAGEARSNPRPRPRPQARPRVGRRRSLARS